jgi:hypothetical protein
MKREPYLHRYLRHFRVVLMAMNFGLFLNAAWRRDISAAVFHIAASATFAALLIEEVA